MKKAMKSGKPTAVRECPSSGKAARAQPGQDLRCPEPGCLASWQIDGPAVPTHWHEPYEPKTPRYRSAVLTAGSARVPDSSVFAEAARRGRLDAATGARTELHDLTSAVGAGDRAAVLNAWAAALGEARAAAWERARRNPNAARVVAGFSALDLRVLRAFWGWRHAEERSDPLLLKELPWDQQSSLTVQFLRYLHTDQGPLGVYADGRVGWDSTDPQAASARVVHHFLASRFD